MVPFYYSCWRALRKQDSEGNAPFLSVSLAAARPSAPFLSSPEPVSTDNLLTLVLRSTSVTCRTRSFVNGQHSKFTTPLGRVISNFYVHYQVNDDEGAAVLSAEAYGSDDESSWLLLEPVADVGC